MKEDEDLVRKLEVLDCSYHSGKHCLNGECVYVSVVPCLHRSGYRDRNGFMVYLCDKWESRGVLKR